MIEVDISNIWGQFSLPELLAVEADIAAAQERLSPAPEETPEVSEILADAQALKALCDTWVVIGQGSNFSQVQAAISLLGSPVHGLIFAGDSLSTHRWNALLGDLQERDFCLLCLDAEETAPAVAFRTLRWMLERRLGTDKANQRIRENASPLLPMALAGVDIEALCAGAAADKEAYAEPTLENPVWQYAAVRHLMARSGRSLEVLHICDPKQRALAAWWRSLFAGGPIFPATAELPGLLPQAGPGRFDTLLRFAPPEQKHVVGSHWEDLDGLNHLEGMTLDQIENNACQALIDSHTAAGVPVLVLECGALAAESLGSLLRFWEQCHRLLEAVENSPQ